MQTISLIDLIGWEDSIQTTEVTAFSLDRIFYRLLPSKFEHQLITLSFFMVCEHLNLTNVSMKLISRTALDMYVIKRIIAGDKKNN